MPLYKKHINTQIKLVNIEWVKFNWIKFILKTWKLQWKFLFFGYCKSFIYQLTIWDSNGKKVDQI